MGLQDIVQDLPRTEPVPTRPTTPAQITGIAIHHSGDEADPKLWAWYHTTPPDQGGAPWGPAATVGYHAAVMRNGESFKTAYDQDVTPGVAHKNKFLIHVVLQGNLAKTPPTPAEIRALLQVVRQYQAAYAIPVERVRTHGEWQDDPAWATSCPGIPDLGTHIRFALQMGLE